jgi:hypothetical protein
MAIRHVGSRRLVGIGYEDGNVRAASQASWTRVAQANQGYRSRYVVESPTQSARVPADMGGCIGSFQRATGTARMIILHSRWFWSQRSAPHHAQQRHVS